MSTSRGSAGSLRGGGAARGATSVLMAPSASGAAAEEGEGRAGGGDEEGDGEAGGEEGVGGVEMAVIGAAGGEGGGEGGAGGGAEEEEGGEGGRDPGGSVPPLRKELPHEPILATLVLPPLYLFLVFLFSSFLSLSPAFSRSLPSPNSRRPSASALPLLRRVPLTRSFFGPSPCPSFAGSLASPLHFH